MVRLLAVVFTIIPLPAQDLASRCPSVEKASQASCREIARKDLPAPAKALLRTLRCSVAERSNYDYGSAVDLNGDGSPEYQVCCHPAPHGPCNAVLIGKVGAAWKPLLGTQGMAGFTGACTLFVPLVSTHSGFHDVCLPAECGSGADCPPLLLQYRNGKYSAKDAPPAAAKTGGARSPSRSNRVPPRRQKRK